MRALEMEGCTVSYPKHIQRELEAIWMDDQIVWLLSDEPLELTDALLSMGRAVVNSKLEKVAKSLQVCQQRLHQSLHEFCESSRKAERLAIELAYLKSLD
jgi:hypothetical protein